MRGPSASLARFRRDAAGKERPHYLYEKARHPTLKLSFKKLYRMLPAKARQELEAPTQEPWDLEFDRKQTHPDGSESLTYRFQLDDFECDDLVAAVSTLYSDLCFVLGTVAPANDEQSSLFARGGRTSRWQLTDRIKTRICAKIPEETSENEADVFLAEVEADGEMMDAVLAHWDKKVTQSFATLKSVSPRRNKRAAAAKK